MNAHVILVGKTATHEIAYGVSAPRVRNPRDTSKMASGSSGGSAAALAARQVPTALGFDTGGSRRLPSAFCGATAIRPTFGLVPRSGAMTLAYSFDAVGSVTRGAGDCWLLLWVLTHTAPTEPVSITVDPRVLRIGVTDDVMPEQVAVAATLRALGAEIIEVELPSLRVTQAAGSVLALAELSARFSRACPARRAVRRGYPVAARGWSRDAGRGFRARRAGSGGDLARLR